jgi:multidrug efflux system outer membrane protein
MSKLFRYGLLLLLLSSCTVGPDYSRPTIVSPADWTISYDAAVNMTDTSWWRQFNDPVLDELVETALRNNLDLQAAVARVDQFLGQLRTTRSEYFPQIGVSVSASRQDDTETGLMTSANDPYNYYQGQLSATWELDLWGRIRRSNEAARAQVLASDAGRRGLLLSLVSNVASNYLVLLGIDRQLVIARETESTYAESLNIFQQRYKYGTVSMVELAQVESEYEGARQAIPALEAQIARQEHLISVLLGQNPGKIPRGKLIDELSIPVIPAGLPARLLEQRPDIIQAEQTLIAANANIGVAKALYFPTVSLTGAFGTASIDSSKLFESASNVWNVSGDLLAPLFTFGNIEGQVMTSEAVQREALYNYRQSIISAFSEVEDALVSTTKGREQQDARARQSLALENYARLAKLQFEGGTTGYLQVLDANRELFSAQLRYVETQTGVLTSLVDVYRAMGGGWVDIADSMSLGSDITVNAIEEQNSKKIDGS